MDEFLQQLTDPQFFRVNYLCNEEIYWTDFINKEICLPARQC